MHAPVFSQPSLYPTAWIHSCFFPQIPKTLSHDLWHRFPFVDFDYLFYFFLFLNCPSRNSCPLECTLTGLLWEDSVMFFSVTCTDSIHHVSLSEYGATTISEKIQMSLFCKKNVCYWFIKPLKWQVFSELSPSRYCPLWNKH